MSNPNFDELMDKISSLGETSNPCLYQYFKGLSERTLILNNEIGLDIIDAFVMPIIQWNREDDENEIPSEERQKIRIYLNTPGGLLHEGLTLCHYIESTQTPIDIICLAVVQSMGTLILMSGFNNPLVRRLSNPYTIGLFHCGSSRVEGTMTAIEDYQKFINKYENDIVKKYILKNSKITDKEYKNKNRTEWYMNAEDMLKYGLIDEITNKII